MESNFDIYLHKKFKKQLSVEPKPSSHHGHHVYHRQNGKENYRGEGEKEVIPPVADQNVNDNNRPSSVVPNQTSTNVPVVISVPPSKSSISLPATTTHTTTTQTKPPNDQGVDRGSPPPGDECCPKGGQDKGKYVCTYCNLVCSKPSVLQKHIRAHTNERPYPCTSCGFSFKTRSNLYKHCRSRTHANRVLGNKSQELEAEQTNDSVDSRDETSESTSQDATKPYKPRFHTVSVTVEEDRAAPHVAPDLSHHINEIINKNNSIVNSGDSTLLKRRPSDVSADGVNNNNDYGHLKGYRVESVSPVGDEPLNLSNKNRKRSLSEVTEPGTQRSLIKELLLKNLYSDMQCLFCKMIFQTVTELELHKLRSCKGKPSEIKYTRSSSVNVASILTKNKNAFDSIPQLQNSAFPLQSPGPFLGRTRLVESDKSKSFSFDAGKLPLASSGEIPMSGFSLSPLPFEKEKKPPVKLFGGEVKIHSGPGETKSFRIDCKEHDPEPNYVEFGTKVSENRVVKSSLQAGGTVLTNKAGYGKEDARPPQDVIRVYENNALSPKIDMVGLAKTNFNFERYADEREPAPAYKNIMDFSQNAVKLLTPNIKQPSIPSGQVQAAFSFTAPSPTFVRKKVIAQPSGSNFYGPMNLLVDGKVVRYVPGIPGPVAADPPVDSGYIGVVASPPKGYSQPEDRTDPQTAKSVESKPISPPKDPGEPKKFARPNSLALKPTTASLKQHHGLTPTMFNQILISPDTPRVQKKYAQHFLHGNYFSYLGLKSSTRLVYCTLNKTQPFYVPHFKKLSMYSEWRQQDNKTDKLYVGAYDSRQRNQRYVTAGKAIADLIVHSSYKFALSEVPLNKGKDEDTLKPNLIGGFECNDDYPYIRGRGRGRYVCEQCGIRCKKPSMLKKHIRTHSNDRPYTCSQCNFSFKTKGNLTKHMKSKAHTKNTCVGGGSGSSTQLSGTQSSESDTEDSGMDSSDESTRQQEHEAAYGLLSLSQKSSSGSPPRFADTRRSPSGDMFMTTEEIAHVQKTNYAKNKFLDNPNPSAFNPPQAPEIVGGAIQPEDRKLITYLGKTSTTRPLTYPYASISSVPMAERSPIDDHDATGTEIIAEPPKNIRQFHVVQKYLPQKTEVGRGTELPPNVVPTLKVNDVVVEVNVADRKRKLLLAEPEYKLKQQKNDEVMDLSTNHEKPAKPNGFLRDHHPCELNRRSDEIPVLLLKPIRPDERVYAGPDHEMHNNNYRQYDNSAMETLADVATKQVKLEKNTMARSVASEYLKLATKNDQGSGDVVRDVAVFGPINKDVNELIVKPEGNKSCHICAKTFNRPSQLRLHMNIHYLERPFRCDSCSVSFRTKGHLQKHERSASHYSKLSSSPAQSSSEPRPFKCNDCNIAFRIHGHLAKHLRSKMHIMKLECLAKIPFGLYAELERSNSLLTEINTSDGDQCLESLKTLAQKVFMNDPGKLQSITHRLDITTDVDTDS
ncbi:uncharacterized protein LOC132700018 isoform X2 [Cylas formicarius]|uniref:uncharacterized protein LOC132700018 isoform X2 n=1 Tax=Cylas formicarius TaxID=197179 RepID=UPI0029587C20|nr:uncharacterized protein LOC132700018 isoform X2 [Cylas formicarius]